MLTLGQFRRDLADNSRYACGDYRDEATQCNLDLATERSSKRAVVNCQNRYPSPSKRSGLSRVRPHPFSGGVSGARHARGLADFAQSRTFSIDFFAPKAPSLRNEAKWEGKTPCNHSNGRNSGFWLWSGLRCLPLVATRSLSKACLAQAQVRASQLLRELIQLPALLSGLRATSFIANATHRAATNQLEFRAAQRGPFGLNVRALDQSSGQWIFAPLAFLPCRQGAFDPWPRRELRRDGRECLRKS